MIVKLFNQIYSSLKVIIMNRGIVFCILLLWSTMTIAQVGKSKAKPGVVPGYELTNYQKKLMILQ